MESGSVSENSRVSLRNRDLETRAIEIMREELFETEVEISGDTY